MALLGSYSDGTVAITNGTASLVGTGTAWSTQVKPLDLVVHEPAAAAPELVGFVSSVDGDLAITLLTEWQGTTIDAGASYRIVKGVNWLSGAEPASVLVSMLNDLNGLGLVGVSSGAPDSSEGRENEMRVDTVNRLLYQRRSGTWQPVSSGFAFDAFGDVTESPSERDAYDDEAQGFTFFSITEAGFYVKVSASSADWSSLMSLGASVSDVLTELGVSNITVSASNPSGGSNGDIWFKV